jgi:low temperature requirement protein LtrA
MRLSQGRLSVEAPKSGEGVTTLELFFDLVFVYTITQVTDLVTHAHYGEALAVMAVTWWMYDGYCWLSNNVGPTTVSTRVPMLVAMAAFLVMAVATPSVFGESGWPFAIAYTVVVVVHGLQFGRSSLGGSSQAILRVLPLNATVCVGLLLAAVLDDDGRWYGWAVALGAIVVAATRVQGTGFTLRPDHFAERHQLLIIIALGEIVVATGAGAQGRLDEVAVLSTVLLSMVLLAGLWWVYFGGDDARAAEVLASAPEDELGGHAFWAYSMAHLVHILGLVLVAAGLHEVVLEPAHHLPLHSAVCLASGTAVYLLAEVMFRIRLRFGAFDVLAAAALLVAPLTLLGQVNGMVELGALGALVAVTMLVDHRRSAHRGTS